MQNPMSRKKALFWVGLLIYTVSFALVAVADRPPGRSSHRGYAAAILALLVPVEDNPFSARWLFHDMKLDYVALLISGLINPLFLITLMLASLRQFQRTIAILRIILFLMIPFCWVVFYQHSYYPREGHFLWLLGMILVLFSRS